jgi:glycosyl transferase family 1
LAIGGAFFFKLMQDPLVFVIASGWTFSAGISLCLRESQGRPCRILVHCSWYVPHIIAEIEGFSKKADPQCRHMLLTYLCPTQSDVQLLTSRGVDALHIHHNAFIDDRTFTLAQGIDKRYSAVHTANLMKFKRHHLAWGVRQIALITYDPNGESSLDEISGYQEVAFLNQGLSGRIEYLPAERVNVIVNESRCGLILSELEGPNYASTEYLLCGIPVVSTPSLGGRDEFFDPRHVKIVEPSAEAVERAVAEWSDRAPPPEEIRESAMKKCRMHRERLLHWLCAISGQELFATADENFWSPLFTEKLRTWVTLPTYSIAEPKV